MNDAKFYQIYQNDFFLNPTFSQMSCLTLESRLCVEQPLWWSRHIDFHTSCLFCSFVKTNFKDVSANLLVCNFQFYRIAEQCSLPWVPLARNAGLQCGSVFHFSELQNIALFLGCPWSEMQSCGAILFLAFSELQNCAIFLAALCPNCRILVSLGRSTPAAGLRAPNPVLGAWL